MEPEITKAEREELLAAISKRDTFRTHHAKCYLAANHRDCAIVRLLRALDAAEANYERCAKASRGVLETRDILFREHEALKAKLAALVEAVEYAVDFVNHSSCMPMCGLYRTPPTECTCGIDGIRSALAAAKKPHPVQPSPADLVRSTQDGPHPAVVAKRYPELKASKVKETKS